MEPIEFFICLSYIKYSEKNVALWGVALPQLNRQAREYSEQTFKNYWVNYRLTSVPRPTQHASMSEMFARYGDEQLCLKNTKWSMIFIVLYIY